MKPFYPTKSEIAPLLESTQTAIVRPWKRQPKGEVKNVLQNARYPEYYLLHEELGSTCESSPFGPPGTILWCKEQFQVVAWDPHEGDITFKFSDGNKINADDIEANLAECYWFECCNDADKAGRRVNEEENMYIDCQDDDFRIRPAISMPKSACRLWLEVVDVKVCKWIDLTVKEVNQAGFESGIGVNQVSFESLFCDWIWYASVKRIEKPTSV